MKESVKTMPDLSRLKELQALPLERKVGFTAARIAEFYKAREGKVYVSFSGGKDSTVLLYLVRSLFPEVKAVFCDTGLEYPEIRDFVKTFDNVEWVKPKMPFNKVIEKYGYPVVSKDCAQRIYEYHENPDTISACYLGFKDWKDTDYKQTKTNCSNWAFLVDAPFKVSHKCCYEMKKKPLHDYQKKHGLMPFIGTMADESFRRKIAWKMYGCNVTSGSNPRSAPMSFWTEHDVLSYIKQMHIPIASVYGDIVQTTDRGGAYNNWRETYRMYVLYVRRTLGKRAKQISTYVLHASKTVGLLYQSFGSKASTGLYSCAV